ncbi:GWxTD domain-containing protein [Litoribacter ruber]|uniref:GWxTD domain-containing protein n=1 Tax=Litoribacter ruber TaxID=702568 RepID=A0AAP2CF95_9BACT|nr:MULTISPECIES: GWxTD domain-containing protein [Litoribacter]MBS9522827.1 GWxTD domain-containing protein [Litoribacter alkaliphilus]MBT0812334.1 GWxTD domain-containing protein [Litoribacter ruber]
MKFQKLQKSIQTLLLLLVIWSVPQFAFAQATLQNLNQSLRYSRYSRIDLKIIPIKKAENSFSVQMPIEKIEDNIEFGDYLFSYAVVNSFTEEITDEKIIPLTEDKLRYDTDRHFYFEENIEVPADQNEAYVVLWAKDTRQGDEYIYHADLRSPYIFETPSLGAYFSNNIPFDQNFLIRGQALLFKSNQGVNLFSFYYPQEFNVPVPPMETKPAPVQKEVDVIEEEPFLQNVPKTFDQTGYYFIQSDTTAPAGVLVKTVNETFPKVADWDEMVQMVVYISTRREHEKLLEAEDKKRALDEYWINMTKSEDISKTLIREYFRQVEFANILFTDFREGWKTDRGMIYVVMGPPEEVYFNVDREVWVYGGVDSNSKINFTFARVKNVLTPNYYQLNRSRAYQPEWFKRITLWRSGKIAF